MSTLPSSDRVAPVLETARSCVRQLAPYKPGARPSVPNEQVCRLASNENPLGPSPQAMEALRSFDNLARYPDNDGHALKAVLSSHHDCPPECLMLGNGSSDLLDLVACAWLEPGCNAVFARHAFVVYPLVVQQAGATAQITPAYPLDHSQPLGHDPVQLQAGVNDATRVLFIANPNNPTGTILTDAELRTLFDNLPPQVLVVIDEAYAEYCEPIPSANRFLDYPNVVVTRTFSKIYGLAGLRIGYAVAHPDVIGMLNRVRQPFNVNTPAQQAATAAVGDVAHVEHSRTSNARNMKRLKETAQQLDMRTLGEQANFLTLHFGDSAALATAWMRERNILVRALPEYELPDWLRFTIGTDAETDVVVDALYSWHHQ